MNDHLVVRRSAATVLLIAAVAIATPARGAPPFKMVEVTSRRRQ